MRITGGEFRGRLVKVPRGERVRPTQDRVREALFSMLATEVVGARFLDLYAGSGAVGLEALSRGAAEVTWIEMDKGTCRVARENIARIADKPLPVVCGRVENWIRAGGPKEAYDIVFADPPYAEASPEWLDGLATMLRDGETVAPHGLLAIELPRHAQVSAWNGWQSLRDRVYGHTRLLIRQKTSQGRQ